MVGVSQCRPLGLDADVRPDDAVLLILDENDVVQAIVAEAQPDEQNLLAVQPDAAFGEGRVSSRTEYPRGWTARQPCRSWPNDLKNMRRE